MNVARILYPVRVLGPGERIGIWLCGCRRRCFHCANPELWDKNYGRQLSEKELFELLKKIFEDHTVDGITISGGEPFLQTKELSLLIDLLSDHADDILVYTGYRIETLKKRKKLLDETEHILDSAAAIIDGVYIEEKNLSHPLKGSDNQRIFYRDEDIRKKYEDYIDAHRGKNEIQNFTSSDGIIAVGIHPREFASQFVYGQA